MKKIIECVPNISEGQNQKNIDIIVDIANSIDNCTVVDVDSGYDTNRTVITIVGEPSAVLKSAFLLIEKSIELIDLTKHKGTHSRMGATDVCPLVPIKNISMEECVELSNKLAKRVSSELSIPVFLYEKSARKEDRINLANIRKGEFELMPDKLKNNNWKPDYGPSKIHPTAGAIAIGARNFLIAYNINLNTMDKKIASDIALDIREAGRAKRDSKGKIIRDNHGNIIKVPGTLKATKAVGWYLDEYQISQVSMNLTDFSVTSIHEAFEEVRKQAGKRGIRVTGSEIVGLVPKTALIDAGLFYLEKQNKSQGIPDNDIMHIASLSLGLNDIGIFDIKEKVIENLINNNNTLSNMDISNFLDLLSTDSPAPGGGSIAALSGGIAASLVSMVANLTINNKKYKKVHNRMNKIAVDAQKLKNELIILIDEDTNAFNKIMTAFRLPKKSDEEINYRLFKIQEATKYATEIPFKTLQIIYKVLLLVDIVLDEGNKNSFSDSGVASELAIAGAKGAIMNVKINLKDIEDPDYIKSMNEKIKIINDNINELSIIMNKKIDKNL